MPENKKEEQKQTELEPEPKPKPKPRPTKFEKKDYTGTIINIVILIFIISMLGYALYQTGNPSSDKILLLATTTSTANSGLLDEILPDFEDEYDVTVKVTPVGTEQALEMGRRGDVDILMVHSPSQEQEFVEEGYGTKRYVVCYNYFIIVGPPSDPAGLKNAPNSSEAVRYIFDNQSIFVSWDDESGTHTKEKELWINAGFDYTSEIDIPGNGWYYSVSAGIGDTLMRAYELQAYTLTDEGTYWAYESKIDLDILLRDDPNLLNQYSVIPIDPNKFSHVNYDLSMKFVDWITSEQVQEEIGSFEKNGHKLFVPNAETTP